MSSSSRTEEIYFRDAGHGFDEFGLSPRSVERFERVLSPLYDAWFRVESRGMENVPASGAAILVANHGGILPFDGGMLWMDVVRHSRPRRIPRPVADHFVPTMPFVSTWFSRMGVVGGSRGNAHTLLSRGELLMIFPEGTSGVGKLRRQAYELQQWNVGHVELALRHDVPIVPVGIVGPDEQFPLVFRLPVSAFGSPYVPLSLFPLPVVPLPMPVRYHIRYGAPLDWRGRFVRADADRPERVALAASETRSAVSRLIERARHEREGLFR